MGADSDRKEEGQQRRTEPVDVERRRERSADRDVAEMPGRVWKVEQRDVVAPAAWGEGVEAWARALVSCHGAPT